MAIVFGPAIIYTVFNCLNSRYQRDRNRNRYRGRVPEEFIGLRAYPNDYEGERGNPASSRAYSPGHSHPHRHLYPRRYFYRDGKIERRRFSAFE